MEEFSDFVLGINDSIQELLGTIVECLDVANDTLNLGFILGIVFLVLAFLYYEKGRRRLKNVFFLLSIAFFVFAAIKQWVWIFRGIGL